MAFKKTRGASLLLCDWRPAFHKANYENAAKDFTKGLELAPNVEALSKRGQAYELLGERDNALMNFRTILKVAPDFRGAHNGLRLDSERQ